MMKIDLRVTHMKSLLSFYWNIWAWTGHWWDPWKEKEL